MSYCPGCEKRDRRIQELKAELERTEQDRKSHREKAMKYARQLIDIENVIQAGQVSP